MRILIDKVRGVIDRVWRINSVVHSHEYYDSLIPQKNFQVGGIPKVIHQVYMQGWEHVSADILENIAKMRSINPTWSYKAWDNSTIRQYINEHYGPKILDYYDRISPKYPSVRGDFFKFLLMYNEGGLYLDHKSSVSKPLDERYSESYSFLVSYWDKVQGCDVPKKSADDPRGYLMLWFVFSAPAHPILRDLLIQVLKNIDAYSPVSTGVGIQGAFRLAGPAMYTEIIVAQANAVDFVYWIEEWGGTYSLGKGTHGHHDQKGYIAYKQRKDAIIDAGNVFATVLYTAYVSTFSLFQYICRRLNLR